MKQDAPLSNGFTVSPWCIGPTQSEKTVYGCKTHAAEQAAFSNQRSLCIAYLHSHLFFTLQHKCSVSIHPGFLYGFLHRALRPGPRSESNRCKLELVVEPWPPLHLSYLNLTYILCHFFVIRKTVAALGEFEFFGLL